MYGGTGVLTFTSTIPFVPDARRVRMAYSEILLFFALSELPFSIVVRSSICPMAADSHQLSPRDLFSSLAFLFLLVIHLFNVATAYLWPVFWICFKSKEHAQRSVRVLYRKLEISPTPYEIST